MTISFTVETDGRLPSGKTLVGGITQTDAETAACPAHYMINCGHPSHFAGELREGGAWHNRIRGLRADASKRSHAELDAPADLDIGNPVELAQEYRVLRERLKGLNVLGGCCGTDHRHLEAISASCHEQHNREGQTNRTVGMSAG
jgi:S-methylmethionine-dependent homocysteine/selenocysteine methylase